jgi:hypothetical protein
MYSGGVAPVLARSVATGAVVRAVVAGTVARGRVTGTVSGMVPAVVLVVSTVVDDCGSVAGGKLVTVGMVSFVVGMAALVLCGWMPRP